MVNNKLVNERNKLAIEKEKIEMEKKGACLKWQIKKAQTFGPINIENERLQLAQDMDDSRIMLADASLLDEQAKI